MPSSPRPRPQLSKTMKSWDEQAQFAYGLVTLALENLYVEHQKDANFPEDEKVVTKRLGVHLNLLVNQRGASNGLPWIPRPNYDGIQGRDPDYQESEEHEEKRPDIRFEIRDTQDEDGNHKTLTFECKRLGASVSGHSLNKEYVEKGIVRFCRQSHRYGAYSAWGVMIGYIQSSAHDTILQQINTHVQNSDLNPIIRLDNPWQLINSRLEHSLKRPFEVNPFNLLHLWIDLRRNNHISLN